jgi:hypothetical protein
MIKWLGERVSVEVRMRVYVKLRVIFEISMCQGEGELLLCL